MQKKKLSKKLDALCAQCYNVMGGRSASGGPVPDTGERRSKMAREVMTVTVTGHWTYDAPAYGAPWKNETHHIWKMTDEAGTVYVWKTTASFGKWVRTPDARDPELVREAWVPVHKDDIVKITGTVKGIRVYKGEDEFELTRVRFVDRIYDAEADREAKRLARENEKALAKKALLDSVKDGDEIIRMDYRRYKEHYADCETVPDSYDLKTDPRGVPISAPTIEVIVRAGRMVPSGVRGKKFRTWFVDFVLDGEAVREGYYAVSYENAEKRCAKEFPTGKDFHFGMVSHDSPRYVD